MITRFVFEWFAGINWIILRSLIPILLLWWHVAVNLICDRKMIQFMPAIHSITNVLSPNSRPSFGSWPQINKHYLGFCASYQILEFSDFIVDTETVAFFDGVMWCPLLSLLRNFVAIGTQPVDGHFVWINNLLEIDAISLAMTQKIVALKS